MCERPMPKPMMPTRSLFISSQSAQFLECGDLSPLWQPPILGKAPTDRRTPNDQISLNHPGTAEMRLLRFDRLQGRRIRRLVGRQRHPPACPTAAVGDHANDCLVVIRRIRLVAGTEIENAAVAAFPTTAAA